MELLDLEMEHQVVLVVEQEEMALIVAETEPVILHQESQDQHPLHQMDMEIMVVVLVLARVVEAAVVPVALVKMDNLLVLMADLD